MKIDTAFELFVIAAFCSIGIALAGSPFISLYLLIDSTGNYQTPQGMLGIAVATLMTGLNAAFLASALFGTRKP